MLSDNFAKEKPQNPTKREKAETHGILLLLGRFQSDYKRWSKRMQYICKIFVEMHKNLELNCDIVPKFCYWR